MKNNDEELVRKIKCSTGEGEIIEAKNNHNIFTI